MKPRTQNINIYHVFYEIPLFTVTIVTCMRQTDRQTDCNTQRGIPVRRHNVMTLVLELIWS